MLHPMPVLTRNRRQIMVVCLFYQPKASFLLIFAVLFTLIMKNTFLVHITLPEIFTTKFVALIPKHRALINELMEKNIIRSYSLDMERHNVWAFIDAKNEKEVMDILSSFPIIKDVKTTITELAFYDTAPHGLPELIMN